MGPHRENAPLPRATTVPETPRDLPSLSPRRPQRPAPASEKQARSLGWALGSPGHGRSPLASLHPHKGLIQFPDQAGLSHLLPSFHTLAESSH